MIAARVGLEEKGQAVPGTLRKRRPPGSAGVSPACTAVAIRSVCLRCITRQRRRRERREPGRSRAGMNPAEAEPWHVCRSPRVEETPALPGGHGGGCAEHVCNGKRRPTRDARAPGWASRSVRCAPSAGGAALAPSRSKSNGKRRPTRDARAPGWPSSHDLVAKKNVHRSSCLSVVLGDGPASD